MSYGERFRDYRALRKLSQEELAMRLGITVTAISKIEHDMRKVTLEEAVRFAATLKVSLADLAGIEEAGATCAATQVAVMRYSQRLIELSREMQSSLGQ